jgi:cellulose synthase (UDP-forming)
VFLIAPLVYLPLGRTIIPGYWVAILRMPFPFDPLARRTRNQASSALFWNRLRICSAPYILVPTLLALINPKLGKFNVTDKGTTLKEPSLTKDRNPTRWLRF